MGTFKCAWIDAGVGSRGQIERLFKDARDAGCTVTYTKRRGLVNTIYENIRIEGPDHIVRRIHRIIADATGRLV